MHTAGAPPPFFPGHIQVIRFINLKLQQALTLTEDPSLQLLLNNGQVGASGADQQSQTYLCFTKVMQASCVIP
jgi:hypothetical protein